MWHTKEKVIISFFLFKCILLWALLPSICDSLSLQSQSTRPLIPLSSRQWASMVNDAIKFFQKQQQPSHPEPSNQSQKTRMDTDAKFATGTGRSVSRGVGVGGSGMVKLRNIRSDYGDVGGALFKLQELEKEWAGKARPRFGKRAEVLQDNFLPAYPPYLDYEDELESESAESSIGDGMKMQNSNDYYAQIEERKRNIPSRIGQGNHAMKFRTPI